MYLPNRQDNYKFDKELYDDEIEKFLNKHTSKLFFMGTFASDDVPWNVLQMLQDNGHDWAVILNFDKSSQPGSHYTALANVKQKLYYYDSLALSTDFFENIMFLKNKKQSMWTNVLTKNPHQDSNSSACGYYVVWFVLTMYRKRPSFKAMNKICKKMELQENKFDNNQLIVDKIKAMLRKKEIK